MRRLTVSLMSLLAVACADADKSDTGTEPGPSDTADTDTTDTGDTGDTGDIGEDRDPACELVHIDQLVLDRAGGDSLSLVLTCDDATAVGSAEVVLSELDRTVHLSGSADADGTTWRGKSLSELEELVAEKGLSFGMDVAVYDLDGELRVAPPGEDVVDGVRFHDLHTDFSDTPTLGRGQHTGFGLDIAQVVVQQIDRTSGLVDYDGDGSTESIRAWAASVERDGSGNLDIGLDVCPLDGTTCSPAAALSLPLDTTHLPDGHALYGTDPGYRLPLLAVEHTVGKQEVAFAPTTQTSTGLSLQVVRHTSDGVEAGGRVDVKASDLGLSTSAGVHVVATHVEYRLGQASVDDAVGTVTLAGLGESARGGEVVLWGAKLAAGRSSVEAAWTATVSASTAFPAASQLIAGMGTEVLVFFTQGDDGALSAASHDAKTGRLLGNLVLDDVVGPFLAVDSAQADFDGDGTPELVVTAVDENGVLHTVVGELSSAVGFAKADVYTPWGDARAPFVPPLMQAGDPFDFETSIEELDVYISSRGRRAVYGGHVWASGWTVASDDVDALGKAPDTLEVLALGASAAMLAPGADACGDAVDGFCGVVLSQSGDIEIYDNEDILSGASQSGPVSVTSTTWAGGAARGVPVVRTESFVVVLQGGAYVVFDASGSQLGEPLPLDPNLPLSAAEKGGELVVFGGTGDIASRELSTGDLAIVRVDRDGEQGTAVLRAVEEFQIPEKVVMEKEDDFYGRSSGDGSQGITVTYSAARRGRVGGWSSILHYGRISLDSLPEAGETLVLDPADFATVGGAFEVDHLSDGAYALPHPLSPGLPLGPGPVLMRKGRAKRRPVAPDPHYLAPQPLSDMTGVGVVGEWGTESATDDLLAVVPWETGTGCPLATVLVPGASLNVVENIAGAVVLSTSEREDCADLAIPVGAVDSDGEGAEWAVLAQVDPEAETVHLQEVVWDGAAWLTLPGVELATRSVAAVNTGDIDGDGTQELLLDLPATDSRPATRLSLLTGGRALVPLDETGHDFSSSASISESVLTEAVLGLDSTADLDGLDSRRAALSSLTEPWFVLTDDLSGQQVVGLCGGHTTLLSGCGWHRDADSPSQLRPPTTAIFPTSWAVMLD